MLRQHLLVVHAEGPRVDVHEDRLEAAVQHRGDVGHPGDRRHDDLAAGTVQFLQGGQRQQVGRRAGVDKDAVLDAQPVATIPPRRRGRWSTASGSDRPGAADRRPRRGPRERCCSSSAASRGRPSSHGMLASHQNGPLNSMLWRSGRSSGSQPVACPFDQVAGSGGDGAGVGIEQFFQRRRRRTGRRREAQPAQAQVAHCPGAARRPGRRSRPRRRSRASRYRPPAAGRSSRPTRRWCRCPAD